MKPTMYVDDFGHSYSPEQAETVLKAGGKLYGMYHEKVVQSLAADVQAMKTAGMTVITPQGILWEVLDDIRANGEKALEGWQVHLNGQWSRILPLPHGQINLNGNLEYRRIPDGDGS